MTRNPSKLIKQLDKLDKLGLRYYFQYTLTGYPRTLESATLRRQKALDQFKRLADTIGANKVIWRYDPILLTDLTPRDEHLRLFEKIAGELNGYTERVVISFADLYGKAIRNLNQQSPLTYSDIRRDPAGYSVFARQLAAIAADNNLAIFSCAESVDLQPFGIASGKCIDDQLIQTLFKIQVSGNKDKGQREACGCIKSIDIGMYN